MAIMKDLGLLPSGKFQGEVKSKMAILLLSLLLSLFFKRALTAQISVTCFPKWKTVDKNHGIPPLHNFIGAYQLRFLDAQHKYQE